MCDIRFNFYSVRKTTPCLPATSASNKAKADYRFNLTTYGYDNSDEVK